MKDLLKLKANLEAAYGGVLENNIVIAVMYLFPAILVANSNEKEKMKVIAETFTSESIAISMLEKKKFSANLYDILCKIATDVDFWEDIYINTTKTN